MLTRLKAQLSPALVISLIALFVSLGGAGYAAVTVTGKNVKNSSLTGTDVKNSSLTGKDVKNSSLTGSDTKDSSLTAKDIKNGALAGADIKGDSLTGNQILESQLGKVPSATTADTAVRAGSAAVVDKLKTVGSYKKVVSSASDNDPNLARDAATEVPLFSVGAFDIYGKCFTDADAPATIVETYIRTREDGSIFSSVTNALSGSPNYLNVASAENTRIIGATSAGANAATVWPAYAGTFFAAAPGGTGIQGVTGIAAKNGAPASGNGIYGNGNACIFGAHVIG